jgi:drug/metabolite transporter (DMT)-like permease
MAHLLFVALFIVGMAIAWVKYAGKYMRSRKMLVVLGIAYVTGPLALAALVVILFGVEQIALFLPGHLAPEDVATLLLAYTGVFLGGFGVLYTGYHTVRNTLQSTKNAD